MKNLMLLTIVLLILPGTMLAAGLGQSAGHDLDALWAAAQKNYDLNREDAVLLLESRQIAFTHDGALQTRVHRVVWIGTAVGIRSYADLRVPWNSATSTLDVEILRTWRSESEGREGRWWPDPDQISDTAVVHTLPYAVDRADDYTEMRETMLLHDGVELGCIMETAYTITEQGVPASGGVFVLSQRDPAVLCELRVMTPPGLSIQHVELNGAAGPESINPTKGQGLLWSGSNLPALKLPVTASPEAYEPAVAWSTWSSWDALAVRWNSKFQAAVSLEPEQAGQFLAKLNPAMSSQQKLAAVGDYLNEMTRPIHYSGGYWHNSLRPASRTLATAYGHDLDRAALAAALLQAAGLEAHPMLIGAGNAWPPEAGKLPRLQGLARVVVWVQGLENLFLDPGDGTLLGMEEILGHPTYQVGYLGHLGAVFSNAPTPGNSFTVGLVLTPGEDDSWQGEGYFQGQARFSNLGPVVGGDDLLQGPLSDLAGSLLPGATLTAASPTTLLSQGLFEATFALEAATPEKNDYDQTALVLGRPAGGLLDNLPDDMHLYDALRQSPVLGVGGWEQTVIVCLELPEEELLQWPEARMVTNEAGTFELAANYADGRLNLIRTLKLAVGNGGNLPAALWPDLRALLLEEADPIHGIILLNNR